MMKIQAPAPPQPLPTAPQRFRDARQRRVSAGAIEPQSIFEGTKLGVSSLVASYSQPEPRVRRWVVPWKWDFGVDLSTREAFFQAKCPSLTIPFKAISLIHA
jgi:hypothetical protein